MDVESYENIDEQIEEQVFNQLADDDDEIAGYDDDYNLACENGVSVSVWRPMSEFQPELPADEMSVIDAEADKIEVQRLLSMNVITTVDGYAGKLDIPLSAKMVRTWRKKMRTEMDEHGVTTSQLMWMRRSRLVGRDFNFLEYREDVYSPASSSSVVKLLPCLALSDGFVKEGVIATLDVSDAFLQVPQPIPRKISLDGCEYIILKCLPGQRDASRLWYSYFVERPRAHVSVDVCPEQPCILRCSSNDKLCGVLLLHVDDVLIHGTESWISEILIPSLEKEFKLTHTTIPRHQGGTLEFLKRIHVIEPNYASITISAENKHASALIERFSKIDGKPPRAAYTPCSESILLSKADLLSPALATEYRSLVGIAMYLAQERFDLQFVTKTLAGFLQQPTKSAWRALGRLVGYLRFSEDFGLKMEQNKRGSTFMEAFLNQYHEREKNTIEIYSDSDWSGSGDMKSTSSSVHVMNGIIIHSTSRSQKCISLSSTEAEWYAASSGVCDAYYLQHIVEFITGGNCNILTLHTDNSAVRMLSLKFGVGRLRHIRGRMLWLQERMANHELNIRQVPTLQNIADLNTKSHSKNRFLALLYMFGFTTSKDQRVGAEAFSKQQAKEVMRKQVNLVGQVLKSEVDVSGANMSGLNKTAKHVLRILSTCSLMDLASGAMYPSGGIVDSSYDGSPMSTPRALGQDEMSSWHFWLCAAMYLICALVGIGFLIASGAIRVGNRVREAVAATPLVHDEADGMDESDDSSAIVRQDAERRERYRHCSLSEASDPETWMEVRHHVGGSSSEESVPEDLGFPNPTATNCIEAIDATHGEVGNVAICHFLPERASRRLQQATDGGADAGTIRFYTEAVETLNNSLNGFDSGELSNDSLETRSILKNFAVFSPRSNSPTARMTMEEIANVLRQHERSQHDAMEVDGDDENQPMDLDFGLNGIENNTREIGPEEPAVVHGPLSYEESLLQDINEQRTRVLEEIEQHLAEAITQEDIWYWEAQRDWWYAIP